MTTTAQVPVPPARRTGGGPLRLVGGTGSLRPASARSREDSSGPLGGVKSVSTALDVLDCFVDADELGVSDIARRLGVAKSTAHRLLTSLCARGLVDKNPESGQYRLGVHLIELGQLAGTRMRLRRAALPLLEELRQVSGLTAQLAIPAGADILIVERFETMHDLRVNGNVHRRQPVHCSSSGKAIAAFAPEVYAARRAVGFPPMTTASIATPEAFEAEIALVRRRGVAVSVGESLPNCSTVAAPVLDGTGRARAALCLARFDGDLTPDLGRLSQLVIVAARKLSRSLGT
jgi:DNA-binding IclR family transcriptional regulator